uniref:Xyloglucan endo-transglycosylase C-terminal domain-containing protein n=1 Tax=Brassica oleracea var. oleracea TaxID=109376 RepID=A0A0D3A989_BRAOL
MKMRGSDQKNILIVMMVVTVAATARGEDGFVTWGDNYYTTWGHPALVINETSELQLTLDHKSGNQGTPNQVYESDYFLLPKIQIKPFYVDDTAIRVYKKNPDIYYPSVQTMFMHGSVENRTMVDPKEMSYTAKFQASKIDGCATEFMSIDKFFGLEYWWNRKENWELSSKERKLYMNARKVYLDYDYCLDRKRYPKVPQECRSYG